MFSPVARILDMHVCPMQTPAVVPIPHVGGPVVGPGAPTVLAGGFPVSVVGDTAVCFGPPDSMVVGSFTVLAMGKPVVRITDVTVHGGMVLVGCPTVLVGDSGGAGGAAAQAMSAAKAGGSAFARADCDKKAVAAAAKNAPPGPPATGNSWVEVEVVDQAGTPLPYQKVEVIDSTGATRSGYTNPSGVAHIGAIAKGSCKITLPDAESIAWKKL